MPKGPNGEYRPRDSFQSAVTTLKIALGEMTEDDARKLVLKRRSAKKSKASKSRKKK